jgi:hypothetical protein
LSKFWNTKKFISVMVSFSIAFVFYIIVIKTELGSSGIILLHVGGILLCAVCFAFILLHIHTRNPEELLVHKDPLMESTISQGEILKQLGFDSLGFQYSVKGSDSIHIPYYHPDRNTYAVLTQWPQFRNLPLCVFSTVFRERKGSLMTLDHLYRQPLFEIPQNLNQIFDGVTPQVLFEKHQQSLTFLIDQGIPLDTESSANYLNYLKEGLESQRLYIRQRLPLAAMKLLWGLVFQSTVCQGSIMEQQNTPNRIAYLQVLYCSSESKIRH